MTLLFADGFEDGMGDWAVNGSLSTPAGRNGLCAAIGGNGSTISKTFTPSVTVVVGFAHKVNNYDNGELDIIQLCGDSGATQHTTLRASNVGTGLYVYKGGSKFNVLGTANNVTVMNQWAYIEVRFTLHDSTGIVIVKVNGTTVINSTNVDTRESGTVAAYDCIKLTNYFNTASVDDLYICDTTGSYNNDFLGDLAVEHIRPTGDDTVAWTKSTGATNYGCVDEAGAADTADYVSSSTVGQRDLYSTAAAARAAGTVQGVYVAATAQKSDSGARSVGLCVKEGSGGTLRTGTGQALTTGWTSVGQGFDRKADNSAFSIADLNALRIGAEVTA